jgi:hypothetical protein
MSKKSKVKIHREYVRWRYQIFAHQLEPKIEVRSHYMLIVSDRPASQTLLERRNVDDRNYRTPIIKSVANFLAANCLKASRLAR